MDRVPRAVAPDNGYYLGTSGSILVLGKDAELEIT